MKKGLPVLIVLIISACGARETVVLTSTPIPPAEMPLPTVTPVCIAPEPAEDDITRALSFAEDILAADEWEQMYQVSEGGVSVTWQNIPLGAVIYIEALIFPCSYEEPDLDQYFNDENWDATFANYEDHELIAECSTDDGLRLYQFEAANLGFDYDIQYWVMNDTDTRVITVMMTFPFGSESLLDDYSSRLLPELTTCF